MWRRLEAEGCEWDVRPVPEGTEASAEVLEFQCVDGNRPPRRVAVGAGMLMELDEMALRRAFERSLPIGGDHYGRPGKPMDDLGGAAA